MAMVDNSILAGECRHSKVQRPFICDVVDVRRTQNDRIARLVEEQMQIDTSELSESDSESGHGTIHGPRIMTDLTEMESRFQVLNGERHRVLGIVQVDMVFLEINGLQPNLGL